MQVLISWIGHTDLRAMAAEQSPAIDKKVSEVVLAGGGEIVGEEYFPLDHTDYRKTVEKIAASGAEVVFNTIVPPGLTPFLGQLYESGFTKRGGYLVCTYFDENFLNLVPAEQVEGLYGCLDYYQDVTDPFSKELLNFGVSLRGIVGQVDLAFQAAELESRFGYLGHRHKRR